MARTFGRRRIMSAAAVVVGAVLVGLVALTAASVARPGERVARLWVGAEIGADGSARITEVIDYVFADGPRHGIYRDVPGPEEADEGSVQVTMDGRPVPFEARDRLGLTRVTIGDPDTMVNGTHRYRLEYTLPKLGDDRHLAWDAVGTDWEVPIGHAEVHLTAGTSFDRLSCASGDDGIDAACSIGHPAPGRFDVAMDGLDGEDGLTLNAERSSAVETAPLPPAPDGMAEAVAIEGGVFTAWLWGTTGALAAAMVVALAIRFVSRPRVETIDGLNRRRDLARLASSTPARPEPPSGLGPALAAVLHADRVLRAHQSAWLLGAAVDGHLSIIGGKKRPVLRRSRDKAPADRLTSEVLRTLFARRREVPLGQYNKAFGAAWKMLRDGLEQWRRDPGNGLWEPSGTFRRRIAAWSGLAAALTGIVLVAAGASGVAASDTRAQVALGAGLAGAGLAALFFAWELRVRTPLGARLWSETEAYRRHLAGLAPAEWATGNRAAMSAWAVALGLTAPLRAASADAGTSASGMEFRPDVALGLQAVAVQTATPPSSSGSSSGSGYSGSGDGGSSGGGDSGGGGGDGGGGSW